VLVHFEGDAAVTEYLPELSAGRGATVDPAVFVDVVNRENADPVLQGESEASYVVAGENLLKRLKSVDDCEEWCIRHGWSGIENCGVIDHVSLPRATSGDAA
jgi:hypothetical protein